MNLSVKGFFKERDNALAVSWLINAIGYSIVYPFIPVYLSQTRRFPMEQAGLVFPVMASASIILPPLIGWLTDRFPRTALMRAGQGGRAAAFLILALLLRCEAPFWLFCVLFFLNAGTGVVFNNSANAYLSSITTPEERPKAYSKIRIGNNVGWALGPALGAFMADLPYDWLFIMTALISFGSERYIALALPEPPLAFRTSPAKDAGLGKRAGEGRPMWRDPYITAVLCGIFLLGMLSSQLYSVLSVYSTQVVGITRRYLGFVYFFNGFTIILCQIPVTALMTKLKVPQNWQLVSGALFYVAGYFLLGFAAGFTDLVVAVIILTFGELIVQVSIYSVITEAAPPGRVGRYLSGWVLVHGIASSLGPYVGSLLFARLTGQPILLWTLLSFFGFLAAVVFAAIAVFRKKHIF